MERNTEPNTSHPREIHVIRSYPMEVVYSSEHGPLVSLVHVPGTAGGGLTEALQNYFSRTVMALTVMPQKGDVILVSTDMNMLGTQLLRVLDVSPVQFDGNTTSNGDGDIHAYDFDVFVCNAVD